MNQPHTGGLVAFQSDRVEELVDRLVAEMAHHDDNTIGDCVDRPFVDHRVVLPTRNLETYLDFEIAARRGVSFGIEFLTMERFLKSLLPEDDDGQAQIRILDQMAMTRLVVSLLDDPAIIEKPALGAVRDFIAPTEDARPEMIERRKFQLAFRVGRLFEEYGYARQNMLRHWRRGDSGLKQDYGEAATAAHLEIETWQMALWTELFGPDGKARQTDGDERPWMSLPEAVFEYAQGDDRGLDWPRVRTGRRSGLRLAGVCAHLRPLLFAAIFPRHLIDENSRRRPPHRAIRPQPLPAVLEPRDCRRPRRRSGL